MVGNKEKTPKVTDDDISSKKANIKAILGKNFDEESFNIDAQNIKDNNGSINNLVPDKYRKGDNDNTDDNFGFKCSFKDGIYTAYGSDGKIFSSKDSYELNQQIAKEFKQNAAQTGKEAQCRYESTSKDPEFMKNVAKAFINEGVVISGDIPNDPKFWNDFKQEYLNNQENSLEEWNRLTRKIPPEYMGKDKNLSTEKSSPQISKAEHIKNLRNGVNINLTPPQPHKDRSPNTNTQENNILIQQLKNRNIATK